MRPRLALLVGLLVVLAGCGGTTFPEAGEASSPAAGTQTRSSEECFTLQSPSDPPFSQSLPTPDEDSTIAVVGGELGFDAATVFSRVENLTGTSARPPDEIVVTEPEYVLRGTARRTRFDRLLGLRDVSVPSAGWAYPGGRIELNAALDRTEREWVLAHESYHVITFQENYTYTTYGDPAELTAQERSLRSALAEGSANYVEQVYWRRYTSSEGTDPATRTRRRYRNASPSNRTLAAPHHLGYRYVAARIDSPRDLDRVFENPPRTTEELLHRLPPGSEPPAPLAVTVPDHCEWTPHGTDTRGELFMRHVLQVGVDDETANRAAAGWGNDTVVRFHDGSTTGFVWALRFDDAADATEFGDALEGYLDARGTREGQRWTTDRAAFRVHRPTDRSVVLVFGPDRFASEVSAAGEAGEVRVRTP